MNEEIWAGVILSVCLIIFIFWPIKIITRKAGLRPWFSYEVLFPVLGCAHLWYLALRKWPNIPPQPTITRERTRRPYIFLGSGYAEFQKRLTKRGVSIGTIAKFDWDNIIETVDDRFKYHETRYMALGLASDQVYAAVYTVTGGAVHLISLRKANSQEIAAYERHHETQAA